MTDTPALPSNVEAVMARRAAIRAAAHPPSVNVTIRGNHGAFVAAIKRATRAMERLAEAMR